MEVYRQGSVCRYWRAISSQKQFWTPLTDDPHLTNHNDVDRDEDESLPAEAVSDPVVLPGHGSALLISVADAKDSVPRSSAGNFGYHSAEPKQWQRLRKTSSLQAERDGYSAGSKWKLPEGLSFHLIHDLFPAWEAERGRQLLIDMGRNSVIHYRSEVYLERKKMQWKFGLFGRKLATHQCFIPGSMWLTFCNIFAGFACLLSIFALFASAADEKRELSASEWVIPLLIIGVSSCLPGPTQTQLWIQQVRPPLQL